MRTPKWKKKRMSGKGIEFVPFQPEDAEKKKKNGKVQNKIPRSGSDWNFIVMDNSENKEVYGEESSSEETDSISPPTTPAKINTTPSKNSNLSPPNRDVQRNLFPTNNNNKNFLENDNSKKTPYYLYSDNLNQRKEENILPRNISNMVHPEKINLEKFSNVLTSYVDLSYHVTTSDQRKNPGLPIFSNVIVPRLHGGLNSTVELNSHKISRDKMSIKNISSEGNFPINGKVGKSPPEIIFVEEESQTDKTNKISIQSLCEEKYSTATALVDLSERKETEPDINKAPEKKSAAETDKAAESLILLTQNDHWELPFYPIYAGKVPRTKFLTNQLTSSGITKQKRRGIGIQPIPVPMVSRRPTRTTS